MSRQAICSMLAAIVGVAMTLPLAASPAFARSSPKVIKTTITLVQPANLASKELKAGEYQVVADESKVTLRQHGRTVAEAPVLWMDEKAKSSDSSVVLEGNVIREIHFTGKTRYVSIQ